MDKLIVLNNERVSKENEKFFSRNYNFKLLPEGLNKHFNVEYIVRKSNIKVISKAEHNKVHPEKGGRKKCKSGFSWNKKAKACIRLSVLVLYVFVIS